MNLIDAIVVLYFGGLVYTAIYVLLTAACALKFGAPVQEVDVGIGPKFLGRRFGNANFNWRLLPLSGGVAIRDFDLPPDEVTTVNPLGHLRVWQRIVISAVGPASNLIIALITLWFGTSDAVVMWGVLALYNATFNLLPVPLLAGFDILLTLIPQFRYRFAAELVPPVLLLCCFIFILLSLCILVYFALARPDTIVELGHSIANMLR